MTQSDWAEEELLFWEREAHLLLRELGLCPYRKRERALCLLLALAAARPELLPEGLRLLYEESARRAGSTPQSVQRNLRRSLEQLWQLGDRKQLRRWFARLEGSRCPGSAAFLLVLARKVRERQRPRNDVTEENDRFLPVFAALPLQKARK